MAVKPTPITGRVNTTRLVEIVAAETCWSIDDTHEVVLATLNVIARAMASGHSVVLTNFGTFSPVWLKERNARNVHAGEMTVVPARWAPRVKFSGATLDGVRNQDSSVVVNKAPQYTYTPRPEGENDSAAG